MLIKICLIALLGVAQIYASSNFDFSYLSIPRMPVPDVTYFDCEGKEQYHNHPWDCTRFVKCGDGRAFDQPCPACNDPSHCQESPYLFFDIDKNACNFPDEVDCNCKWENIVKLHKKGILHRIGSLSNLVFTEWSHFSKCGSGPGNCNWIDFADCAIRSYKNMNVTNSVKHNVTMDTLCQQYTSTESARASEGRIDKNCEDLECTYRDKNRIIQHEKFEAPPEETLCDKAGGRCRDKKCIRGGSELMAAEKNTPPKT